jgi:hypothetical protein
MASGHVNRANRPNTWLHRPRCRVKILLANPEPSTHGPFRSRARQRSLPWSAQAAIGPRRLRHSRPAIQTTTPTIASMRPRLAILFTHTSVSWAGPPVDGLKTGGPCRGIEVVTGNLGGVRSSALRNDLTIAARQGEATKLSC